MKKNTLKQQRASAELEAIIDDFGRAMRDAYKPYVASYVPPCQHERQIPFTPRMEEVWGKYVDWCAKHGEKA